MEKACPPAGAGGRTRVLVEGVRARDERIVAAGRCLFLQAPADGIDDRPFIGKLAGLELRIKQFSVDGQLEASASGGDQFQVLDLLLVRVEK